jgi:hypothetical protein
MERSITFIEKLFVSTKGKVEWLEEQNETLIEIAQKQQMELEWLTKKIQLLQEYFKKVQHNPSVVQEELAKEMKVLKQKAELIDLHRY